jgi:hypothetical protein
MATPRPAIHCAARDRLRQRGEEAKGARCGAEERELDPSEERRQRRVGDVPPGEMTCVIECRQFVAMESILTVAPEMEQQLDRGEERDPADRVALPIVQGRFRSSTPTA